ncbi:hypothetical protein [Candidatus Nitrososphaera sp. FF02]|uniref:hypothetical protein n=1 Tax=Candidatus Nitrososphaera sp. FF02 TaxID=3398226 RepID=UPI0039E743CC
MSDRLEKRTCRYSAVCRFYRLADATCNSGESHARCGTYDLFDGFHAPSHKELGQ